MDPRDIPRNLNIILKTALKDSFKFLSVLIQYSRQHVHYELLVTEIITHVHTDHEVTNEAQLCCKKWRTKSKVLLRKIPFLRLI